MTKRIPVVLSVAAVAAAARTHTIKIEPSDKPFKFDLNVKIDQEIRLKLDKEVEGLIADNPDLF